MDIPDILIQQIRERKAVIFLGAGASRDTVGPAGKKCPTTGELIDKLSTRFLGGKYKTSSLSQVAELAISETNLMEVQTFVSDLFTGLQPSPEHLKLPRFDWYGLATTNYDLLVEEAFRAPGPKRQTLRPFIETTDRVDDSLKDPNNVLYIKLHGCVTRINNPACPLILTTDQYIDHRDGRGRLFDIFRDWGYEHPIIFVGQSLQDPDIRAMIGYPYSLLRGTVLIVFGLLGVSALLVMVFLLAALLGRDRGDDFLILLLLSAVLIALSAVALFVFTIWRLALFIRKLNPSEGQVKVRRYRSLAFSVGTLATLVLPIWWSVLALEPPAAQVAASPNPTLIFDDQKRTVTLNIELRNFSGHPLNAIRQGTVLEWWDDEHPITETDFFYRERVPNGKLLLEMPNDVLLTDGFKPLTFSGDLKNAVLFPRSFTPYDFMGGPEADPTPSEVDVVRNSFEEIFHGYRKGRIEVRFEVVTEGGRTSYRSVVLPRSGFGL